MRVLVARLAFAVLWFLVAAPSTPAAEAFACQELGVTFPAELGGLPLTGVTDYERDEPGLGVGLSYRKDRIKADLYVYSAGIPVVPAGVKSKLMDDHFYQMSGDVVEMERRGVYEGVQILIPEEVVLIGRRPFLHANLRFAFEGTPMDSHIYLTGLAGRFLKIRFSFPESDAQTAREIQRAFLAQLGGILDEVPAR